MPVPTKSYPRPVSPLHPASARIAPLVRPSLPPNRTEEAMAEETRVLASYAAGIALEAIPPEVARRAKHLTIDLVGSILRAGAEADSTPSLYRTLQELGLDGAGPCTVPGSSRAHAPPVAADHSEADGRLLRSRRNGTRQIGDDEPFRALRDIGKRQRAAGREQLGRRFHAVLHASRSAIGKALMRANSAPVTSAGSTLSPLIAA